MVDCAGIFCLITESAHGWARFVRFVSLVLAALSPAFIAWLVFRRKVNALERFIRSLIRISDDLGTASAVTEAAAKLEFGLPGLFPGASTDLYVHDVATGTLKKVATKE